jgi:hypothetical protein
MRALRVKGLGSEPMSLIFVQTVVIAGGGADGGLYTGTRSAGGPRGSAW